MDNVFAQLKSKMNSIAEKVTNQQIMNSMSLMTSIRENAVKAQQLSNNVATNLTSLVTDIKTKIATLDDDIDADGLTNESNIYLPWTGKPNEAKLKSLILQLFEDQETFTSKAPLNFEFDLSKNYTMARSLLRESEKLAEQRYIFVPAKLSEEDFWKNTFYRISLIVRSFTDHDKSEQPETHEKSDSGKELKGKIQDDTFDTIDEELNYLLKTDVDYSEIE